MTTSEIIFGAASMVFTSYTRIGRIFRHHYLFDKYGISTKS